jgi:hypothetical protein
MEIPTKGTGPNIINIGAPQMKHPHAVLRVTTKGGKEYCVDLAGAQFGVHDPVSAWDNYASRHVRLVASEKSFGTARKALINPRSDKMMFLAAEPATEAILGNQRMAIDDMEARFSIWLAKNDVSVAKMMKMKKEEHEQLLVNMSEILVGGMQTFVNRASKTKNYVVAMERGPECNEYPDRRCTYVYGDGKRRFWDELRMAGPKQEWEKLPSEEEEFEALRGGKSIFAMNDDMLRKMIHQVRIEKGLLNEETRKWPREEE